MIELLITIVLFLLLILGVIWLPFLKQSSNKPSTNIEQVNVRDETNVQLYHEHKAEIERDYQQGSIDEENYQYLLEELDKGLLQDIDVNKHAGQDFDQTNKRFSIVWPSLLSVFVLAFSFALYAKLGAYDRLTQTPPQANKANAHQQLTDEQKLLVRIQKLQELTSKEPDNADAWYSLGQALIGVGDFNRAIEAIDQVIRIEGEKADLYGAKAQAYYYQNNQQINATVQNFIDKALALDPNDASTNIMLGMDGFIKGNYQSAIDYWQKVVGAAKQNVNVAALTEAINEAKRRLSGHEEGGDHSQHDHSKHDHANHPHSAEQHEAATVVTGPQLTLAVTLSDDIFQKLSEGEDKTVFIYATPNDGRRMPLAAIKIMASELPSTITLSTANAMTPQATLASAEQVHVYAVISKLGQPGINSGDFIAKKENVAVAQDNSAVIDLVIDTVQP